MTIRNMEYTLVIDNFTCANHNLGLLSPHFYIVCTIISFMAIDDKKTLRLNKNPNELQINTFVFYSIIRKSAHEKTIPKN